MWLAIIGLYLCMVLVAAGAYLLYREIQDSREQVTVDNCGATNQRHDDTIQRLRGGIDAAKEQAPTKERRAEIEQQYQFTVSLIDALAPTHENCEAYAEDLIR